MEVAKTTTIVQRQDTNHKQPGGLCPVAQTRLYGATQRAHTEDTSHFNGFYLGQTTLGAPVCFVFT